MNFRLLTCHGRQKQPKSNLASARKSSKNRKKSRTRRLHVKNSYIGTKNFYPANYFFQDRHHHHRRQYESGNRVGVNDHYGFLITPRNTPQHPQQMPMNSNHYQQQRQRMALRNLNQFTHTKVGGLIWLLDRWVFEIKKIARRISRFTKIFNYKWGNKIVATH